MNLLADLKRGKRGAIARAISIVEDDPVGARNLLKSIFPTSGTSVVIGVTGPAGAGKSSLIDRTATELKKLHAKPAVLAIDPTSHISGGAILGDRVRMTDSADAGLYIRSIASRGATGAMAGSVRNSIRVLEYAGFDTIIIESVGAGQTEVEISKIADITIVVFNPHTGDSIQAIKAGLTEIGDVYVINKSDLPGASRLYDAVRDYVGGIGGEPLVLKTSAKKGTGITQLVRHLKELMALRLDDKKSTEHARLEHELRDIVLNSIKEKTNSMLDTDRTFARSLKRVQSRQVDPYEAARAIVRKLSK